ncbi:hypothetical protein [Roseovarius sp. EL26]|uniref:hypothetical protein n=1 Tax=Roseovarius sp. EL26 TaxID=2126672 RepID=UPI000EA2E0FC|nr:hypothetical protein [Roseovarius sp. EL26]
MIPELCVIIDDREVPPPQLEGLIGDMHFGDLLRRRRRYLDELAAVAASADDVVILRTDADAEQLARRIESARGETRWLRLPVTIAPLNLDALDPVIRKMRFALDPTLLAPVLEDDAPAVLFGRDAIDLISARAGTDRRSYLLLFAEKATPASHDINFIDLRQPDALRDFLSHATEPRGFNNLFTEAGVFVKSSKDIVKMKAEFQYFKLASPEIKRFLLPTFGYEEADGVASYRMEYLRVPDAALQFVLGSMTQANFDQLLSHFFAFIAARDRDVVGRSNVEQQGKVQIITKMHDRLTTFLAKPEGKQIDALLVAGGLDYGLAGLQQRASLLIEKALSSFEGEHLAFSHGDPCLSNILFDHRIGLIRLIDPRGALNREDAMMHPLYDIAKLSHSFCGSYDFVNNGLFSIEVNADLKMELNCHRGGAPDWVRDRFKRRVADEGWDYAQVRAVEASLFLSMLPLHLDHPRKLLGFALIAEEIITELESLA